MDLFKFKSLIFPEHPNTHNTNVPDSILSGIILKLQPFNFFFPVIFMDSDPWPLIFAPILIRSSARSTISGSLAEFLIIVSPSANVAAIIRFSVAPTEILFRCITDPFNPSLQFPEIYPLLILNWTPIFSNPSKCKSTGRVPIAHPPGNDTEALPYLANNGPKIKNEALILLTNSYDAEKELGLFDLKLIFFFFLVTVTFNDSRSFIMEFISDRYGIFDIDITSSVSKEAAIIGSAEFFAPLIFTSPIKGLPPIIWILSIL